MSTLPKAVWFPDVKLDKIDFFGQNQWAFVSWVSKQQYQALLLSEETPCCNSFCFWTMAPLGNSTSEGSAEDQADILCTLLLYSCLLL